MNGIIVIDNFTIIASAVVLVIAILSCFFTPFVRFKKEEKEEVEGQEDSSLPPLSIVIAPHDEADKLEQNLPQILQQKYPAGFQVIVVIDESAHETEDLLKRMQAQLNENPGDGSLYFTYIPDSSRYVSRKKLAITVGVKAAKTEWVLATEANTVPASEQWLSTMARECTEDNHVVIGYGNYSDEASSFKRFERLNMAYYLMREDTHGKAYRTMSHNVMFRKSDFMREDGFLGNLNLIRGEYDFIVNKYATEEGTALVTDEAAWTIDEAPTRKTWLATHIFYVETRRWLAGGARHRALFNVDNTLIHLSLWIIIAAVVCALLMNNIILLGTAVLSFILTWILRTIIGKKAVNAFGEHVPALLIYPYELSLVWHNCGYAIRHHFADKLDFTTHKQ